MTLFFLFVLVTGFGTVFLVRNELTLQVKLKMLEDHYDTLYRRLPTYNEMVFKHLDKWTYAQWKRWADNRGAK